MDGEVKEAREDCRGLSRERMRCPLPILALEGMEGGGEWSYDVEERSGRQTLALE